MAQSTENGEIESPTLAVCGDPPNYEDIPDDVESGESTISTGPLTGVAGNPTVGMVAQEACETTGVMSDPAAADSLNNRGISEARTGRIAEAIAAYRGAIAARPGFPEALNNLGIALGRSGRLSEAVDCYEAALKTRPDYPEALNNLGIARAREGRPAEAIASFEHALKSRPDYPEAHNNLANALRGEGRGDEAVVHYRRAIECKADYAEARNNLANALAERDELDEAVLLYGEALRLNPRYAEAHNNLGNTLARRGAVTEAIACYRRALFHSPDYSEAYNNLGNAIAEDGRTAEAVALYRMALRLKPDYSEAYNNLGITLGKQGKGAEAEACYVEALRLNPDYPDAHMNRALGWLQDGNYEQGWAEYEWRWRVRGINRREYSVPAWTGEPLGGRTILVYYEQGMGDSLQFIRYAPLVKRRGGVVVFECQPGLIPLLSRTPGIDRLVASGGPGPEFQSHCALMSLPRALGTTLASVPAEVPYLYADPALVAEWRGRLAGLEGYRIGISWQGNPQFKGDRHRSIPLEAFSPLADVPGVRLVSLQKNRGAEQVEALGGRFPLADLGPDLDARHGSFMDTAAVMMNLDLVISADTATAHLAGGLGVNCWLPLSWASDWRWMRGRPDSPWYPTMRLFRQAEPGDWGGVFARMAEGLRAAVSTPEFERPIAVEVAAGELVDKITILEIKEERLADEAKLRHVRAELASLRTAHARRIAPTSEIVALTAELHEVNARIWDVEEELRACERGGEFGPGFVELARSVYRNNDRRAAIKRRLNELLGSRLVEEKSYELGPAPE